MGTAFAAYGANFKDKAQGVLGIGGWDPTLPGAQDYVQRQMALLKRAADGWAAPVTYASLQVLEQAIEKAGTLDRKKVLDTIDNDGPVADHRRADRSQDPHPRQAVGRRAVAGRPVRRCRSERSAGRQAHRLPQAGVVTP